MEMLIRRKKKDDCEGINKVITTSWIETYKNIVDDEFLDNLILNEETRIINCQNDFDENDNNVLVLEVDKKIVGFVKYGDSNYDGYENSGEIYSLYIINSYQGKGYGKSLFLAAINELRKLRHNTLIVGCIDGNNSSKFYIHMGMKKIGNRTIKRGKQDLIENIYYMDI